LGAFQALHAVGGGITGLIQAFTGDFNASHLASFLDMPSAKSAKSAPSVSLLVDIQEAEFPYET
jgi:hypothetical protein